MVLAAIKGLILSWICLLHRVSKSGCWEEVVVVVVGGSFFSPFSLVDLPELTRVGTLESGFG